MEEVAGGWRQSTKKLLGGNQFEGGGDEGTVKEGGGGLSHEQIKKRGTQRECAAEVLEPNQFWGGEEICSACPGGGRREWWRGLGVIPRRFVLVFVANHCGASEERGGRGTGRRIRWWSSAGTHPGALKNPRPSGFPEAGSCRSRGCGGGMGRTVRRGGRRPGRPSAPPDGGGGVVERSQELEASESTLSLYLTCQWLGDKRLFEALLYWGRHHGENACNNISEKTMKTTENSGFLVIDMFLSCMHLLSSPKEATQGYPIAAVGWLF